MFGDSCYLSLNQESPMNNFISRQHRFPSSVVAVSFVFWLLRLVVHQFYFDEYLV